jgi:hypothetical protein
VLPAMVLALLMSNAWLSHSYGHSRMMFDNPIYRMRESIAVALSRMQDKPLHGYLAYRSIQSYLAQHGLGQIPGEAEPLPTQTQLRELVYDPARLERLFQDAAKTPIDERLAPVKIAGNDKGLADYYYWAFRLFGINLTALWLFYLVLLSISVFLFLVTFRRSPFAVYLLIVYLIGHLFMIGYANQWFQTIHNSRFFPTLSLLPFMHLMLLMLQRVRPSPGAIIAAAAQAFILLFVIFCNIEALWEALALFGSVVVVIKWRLLVAAINRPKLRDRVARALARSTWPILVFAVSCLGFLFYLSFALDQSVYRTDTKTHVVWHALFGGMVSASPQLMELYAIGEESYTDTIVYMAVRADLRRRNDSTPEIAYIENGAIEIHPIKLMENMGEYDRLVRRLFFEVLFEHPWLVLKSFVYDKPRDQLIVFGQANLYDLRHYWAVILLGLVAAILYLATGAPGPGRRDIRSAMPVIGIVFVFSLLPTMVAPSLKEVDVILFYLMVLLIAVTLLPVAGLQRWWKQGLPKHWEIEVFDPLRDDRFVHGGSPAQAVHGDSTIDHQK